jgi:hypothetical protein
MHPELTEPITELITETRLITGTMAVVADRWCCIWPAPAKTQKDPDRRSEILDSQNEARTTLDYRINGNYGGSGTLTLPCYPLSGFLN